MKLSALELRVCVQKSMHVTFSFAFSSRYAKYRTSFCKVMWQHIEGTVVSTIRILLEIYFSFQQ